MFDNPLLIALMIFLLTLSVLASLYAYIIRPRAVVASRLRLIGREDGSIRNNKLELLPGSVTIYERWLTWILKKFPEPNLRASRREKLLMKLARAGFMGRYNAKLFEAARFGLMVLLAVVMLFVVGFRDRSMADLVLGISSAIIVGWILPEYYIARRCRVRMAELAKQLPDVIDLLIVCVEAGQGLYEAIKTVGGICARQGQIFGEELNILSGELAAGSSLADGLQSMALRTGVEDIRTMAAVLVQSEKLGARMGTALRAVSDSLRLKRRLRVEEAAQKATIKMLFPLTLFVLPAMMLVVIGPALIEIFTTLHR